MKAWVEIISTAINEGNCLKILSNVGFARQKGTKLCDARPLNTLCTLLP